MSTSDNNKLPKPPVLNREQQRIAFRLLRHKINLRLAKTQRRTQVKLSFRCERCGLPYLAPTAFRCQCQVRSSRECAMCHERYQASSWERRFANVCAVCGAILVAQRENEQASAAEAQRRFYEQQEWDAEQHRLAQEAAIGG